MAQFQLYRTMFVTMVTGRRTTIQNDPSSLLRFLPFVIGGYILFLIVLALRAKFGYRAAMRAREAFYVELSKVQYKMGLLFVQQRSILPDAEQILPKLFVNTQKILTDTHPSFIRKYQDFKQDVTAIEQQFGTPLMAPEHWNQLDTCHKNVRSAIRWYGVVRGLLGLVTIGIGMFMTRKVTL